jgi:hypothetical protein
VTLETGALTAITALMDIFLFLGFPVRKFFPNIERIPINSLSENLDEFHR